MKKGPMEKRYVYDVAWHPGTQSDSERAAAITNQEIRLVQRPHIQQKLQEARQLKLEGAMQDGLPPHSLKKAKTKAPT